MVDAQFAEAVLDPDAAWRRQLEYCCGLRRSSKFRCSICGRLVCAFCQVKQHAFDGIQHYPAGGPRYRGRSNLTEATAVVRSPEGGRGPALGEGDSDSVSARRKVALLKRKVNGDDRAPLSLTWLVPDAGVRICCCFCSGLCESGDGVSVSLSNNRLSVGPRNGVAIVDRPLAYQAMGALECVVFGSAVSRWSAREEESGRGRREPEGDLTTERCGQPRPTRRWRDSGGGAVWNQICASRHRRDVQDNLTHWLISTQGLSGARADIWLGSASFSAFESDAKA